MKNIQEISIALEDLEWPFDYIDHDREIVRAIVFDDYGYYYFVRAIRDDDLILGSPLSAHSRSLIDVSYRIKKPVISDYNDIEDILKLTFNMYEDFKKEYVKIRSY